MRNKIDLTKFSKDELQKIVSECTDKAELAKKLGFTFTNGKIYKKITELIIHENISISHFNASAKLKARRKYPIIKKNCPVCNFEFETRTGHSKEKITCSYKCSNIYFADIRHTDVSKAKASAALIKFNALNGTLRCIYNKYCSECNLQFQTHKSEQIFCSTSCATSALWKKPDYRNNLLSQLKQRIDDGYHKGWSSRIKLQPSYPEQYVMSLLNELGVSYEKEFKVSKWFIDFADPIRKLALEIDGAQHNLPERKLSDANKDYYLVNNGWKILRIKWKKVSKEFRKYIVILINEFFNQSVA